MTDLTRYALAAAARGWHVFPLTPYSKRPLRGFTDWERHATTDPARIRDMWARGPFNIGIACGPSHLVVLDLDTPKPGQHPPPPWNQPGINDGADVLATLCEQAREALPLETFTVRTRRGGTHLYFTAPPGARLGNTAGRLGWLIDTRASGGYVVAPGSHVELPDGTGHYEVLHDTAPAPLPRFLFQHLQPAAVPATRPVRLTLPSGRRRSYLHAAIVRELERVTTAPEGQRNSSLYLAAIALGQLVAGGALDHHEVSTLLEQAGGDVGLSPAETRTTVASGLRAGAKRPRTLAA
ncbi:DNA primase [Spongiactinospora rosea]|uniref:DNA primase n=1 Tax=Spongiactinospora rosea TaxID=2248750 RepID=A0A366LYC8_9ACTN|nr:bifunctional DNA primase/polymerase [Spongiactinospora rosea]RBQ18369.1 DNA primase [Spongiactinospora rosea]